MNRLLFISLFVGLFFCPSPIAGAETESSGLLIKCNTTDPVTGELTNLCTIEDFLQQFVVIVSWGYSFVVFLAVLMLVYGGIQWLTAAGRSSKIDEGKRIILGTVVGVIISFSAYIIVNFAVSAITGTTVRLNPFGQIATVFNNDDNKDKSLIRPFSGTDSGTPNATNCQNQWDRCIETYWLYCTDGGNGNIKELQVKLNGLGCSCGEEDGCYGSSTFSCVRRFQLANELPPTGDFNQAAQQKLAASPVACNNAQVSARVSAISALLPVAPVTRPDSISSETTLGCCVVRNSAGDALFCANGVTQRACVDGVRGTFVTGDCRTSDTTKGTCGMCYQPVEVPYADSDGDGSLERCFQLATRYYCENVIKTLTATSPKPVFVDTTCFGNSLCDPTVGYCKEALFISSDPSSGYN